jgi:ATP-binding cassette subfamily F protein 3
LPGIIAEGLAYRYGEIILFQGISLHLESGDRMALVGANGSGKSTLLRLLVGLDHPWKGMVRTVGQVRLGYLPQEPKLRSELTLFEEMLSVFEALRTQQAEMRQLEHQMATAHLQSDPALLNRYAELLHLFEASGGYDYEYRIHQVLTGLGFSVEEEGLPVARLSGGQWARAALARLLLSQPDLLVLDEPTNHLDLEAREWLEGYLDEWKGGYLLVSHDRYALDRLAQRIWALEFGQLREYKGNYHQYVMQRDAERERQWKLYEEQQAFIAKTEDFIRRNLGDKKTSQQAHAREKILEKLERIEKPREARRLHLKILLSRDSGERVLETEGLAIGYRGEAASERSEKILFRCPALLLRRGERVVLIGPNGSGKTTFLKVLLGRLQPLGGRLQLGEHVHPCYFRQSQWDPEARSQTLLEALLADREQPISVARDYLGQFLFSEDDVFKQLGDLSGGELSRLALARLTQMAGNLLLLDEPTNHLDIDSREVLQEALADYPGTILLVTHDRYLIAALATQIWEIREGQLRVYPGNYEFYRRKRREEGAVKRNLLSEKHTGARREEPRQRLRRQQRARARLQTRESELTQLTADLEAEIAALERALVEASTSGDRERLAQLTATYEKKRANLEQAYAEWSRVAEELSRLEPLN